MIPYWKYLCVGIFLWSLGIGIVSPSRFRLGYLEPCNNKTRKCNSASWLTCQEDICNCSKPEEMIYDSKVQRCVVRAGERCRFAIGEDSRYEFIDCVENAECDRSQHICTCHAEEYYESEEGYCNPLRQYMEPCDAAIECYNELQCVNNQCDCNPENTEYNINYNRYNGEPICVGIVGKPCIRGQCASQYRCLAHPTEDSRCACASGLSEWEGECYIGYSQRCSLHETQRCSQHFNCINGECNCKFPQSQFYDRSVEKCISYVNGPCKDDSSCNRNSECIEINNAYNQCRCKTGYIESRGLCDKNYGNICGSNPGPRVIDMTEIERNILNEPCDRLVPLSCVNGRCNCVDEGMSYNKEQRKCVWLVGFKCDASKNDCVDNAICINRSLANTAYCECTNEYEVTSNRTCVIGVSTLEEAPSTVAPTRTSTITDEKEFTEAASSSETWD